MSARTTWARILSAAGGIGMVVGAVDPLHGSLVVLSGSGVLALGTYLAQADRRVIASKAWAFVLVLLGVAAVWGLTAVGGFGGTTGRSPWWGLLILPYVVGWNLGIWGPGSPRWLLWAGMAAGLWYEALAGLLLQRKGPGHWGAIVIIAVIGIVMLVGCIYRLLSTRTKGTPARC